MSTATDRRTYDALASTAPGQECPGAAPNDGVFPLVSGIFPSPAPHVLSVEICGEPFVAAFRGGGEAAAGVGCPDFTTDGYLAQAESPTTDVISARASIVFFMM